MKPNIGNADQSLRVNLGLILVAIGLYATMKFSAIPGILLLLGGVFSVYEAYARWCILYALLGKNTCSVAER